MKAIDVRKYAFNNIYNLFQELKQWNVIADAWKCLINNYHEINNGN